MAADARIFTVSPVDFHYEQYFSTGTVWQ